MRLGGHRRHRRSEEPTNFLQRMARAIDLKQVILVGSRPGPGKRARSDVGLPVIQFVRSPLES